MLDAVVNYLPSPLDIPPVKGINPDTDKEEERKADDKEAVRRLRVQDPQRPPREPDVLPHLLGHGLERARWSSNSTRGKRERIGRILRMHANKREELTEADSGNIYAAVGLKDTRTGDTLCDEKRPIILEKMIFPEPVISIAIEPKTKADVEKLGIGLQKLAAEDPSFRIHTDEESGQTIISGMGELHLDIICDRLKREFKVESNVGKPEVAYREAISKERQMRVQVRQAVRWARPVRSRAPRDRARRARHGLRVRQRHRRRRHPERVHPRHREGRARGHGTRRARWLPARRHVVPPLRRQLPRRRLERAGVRNRRFALLPGRREARGLASSSSRS